MAKISGKNARLVAVAAISGGASAGGGALYGSVREAALTRKSACAAATAAEISAQAKYLENWLRHLGGVLGEKRLLQKKGMKLRLAHGGENKQSSSSLAAGVASRGDAESGARRGFGGRGGEIRQRKT